MIIKLKQGLIHEGECCWCSDINTIKFMDSENGGLLCGKCMPEVFGMDRSLRRMSQVAEESGVSV